MLAGLLLGGCTPLNQAGTSATSAPSPTLVTLGKLTLSQNTCLLEAGAPFAAGKITLLTINQRNVPAMFTILTLDEGHTYAEAKTYMDDERRLADAGQPLLGRPPYLSNPRIYSLNPGETNTAEVNLVSGMYVIICLALHPQLQEQRVVSAAGLLEVK
jgi:hypothetical protein